MSMTLSGNGTITGLVSGGLPDGTVLPADLSTGGPYWDTSGNLGIGTASPAQKLVVNTAASGDIMQLLTAAGGGQGWKFGIDTTNSLMYCKSNTSNYKYQWQDGTGTGLMTIDASGNLGVGRSATAVSTYRMLELDGLSGGYLRMYTAGALSGYMYSATTEMGIGAKTSAPLLFYTNDTERMRLDSSGNMLVGTTSNARGNRLLVNGTSLGTTPVISIGSNYNQYGLDINGAGGVRSDGSYLSFETVATSGDRSIYFAAGKSGGVYLWAGATSWTSASDERVKDIIEPITNAAEKVSSLRAVIGKYKTDEEGTRRSFLIAQDVQAVLPEAVNVQNDEQGTLGLQYTDVIPLLTAALQELIKEVADLKAEVASLKGEQ